MEEEPLLTGSINRGPGDYGSHDNGDHDKHEESPGSRRPSYSATDDSYPVHEDADAELYIQQAVVFIEDAIQYRSINHRVDSWSLWLYRWYYSKICQWGLGFTIAVVLGLAFIERPSSLTYTSDIRFKPKPWEPPCGLTEGIEMVCLCVFILDITVKSYLIGWEEFRTNKWLIGYVVVIAASVIDWMLSISMMCSETLRVRRLIRPFFLLQNSSLMKKTLKCIKRTLPEIASVILLLALHICLFTMIGMLIFSKTDDPKKNGEWETYFKNLPQALSSLLVLLTTANNPDVMIPAYSLNRGYSIFFILFSVFGTYLLMNLMTAIIYNQFRGYLLMSVQTSIIRRRLGIRAAFEVLCCPGRGHTSTQSEGHVERVAMNMFLQVMERVHMKFYCRQAIIKAARQFPDGFINGEDFQRLFNELDKDFMKEHPQKPEYSSSILQSIQNIYSHFYITVLGNVVALANVLCICTILVLNSEKTVSEKNNFYMEIINCIFILYYVIEMLLKIVAFGWKGYLSYRNNIFDGFLTVLLLTIQIAIFITYRIPYEDVDPVSRRVMALWEMVRLINMLIVFRFLRIIPEIKLMAVVASTLVDLVKNLRAFAGILLVVYYVYAVLGIWLFQGAITLPSNTSLILNATIENKTDDPYSMSCGTFEQLEYWPNNFDDFASSLVLLYNIMVVNNWHVFTDAYIRYTTEWSLVYFVAWWLTSSVMWVNLFVALILENFTYKWDRSNALSVEDVERIAYQSTVQLIFREHVQEPTEEELLAQLQQHPHLHLSW
ncbi:two pore calcium channel protein 2 [Puntigrus tetrazona]|uniref:two pore calcium channel protein 2 n=1 Tax=Puntigrus tetrazona TaxID=1606681 RepID=UPI001C89926B|nr:two pore calcium channel protein 2 [Puntigrus tetrazona]